jgi:hypothetical protein
MGPAGETRRHDVVRELLTNYGPVALIWFDTPINMTTD